MSRRRCTKEWYKAFLQASSMHYSGLALSEVSPEVISHSRVSCWLNSQLRDYGWVTVFKFEAKNGCID